jgi:endonuclease/exonuclease/phosphatase family metal-dependent hydrolase
MKLASYNVENLFLRPVAMNQDTVAAGTPILAAHAKVNELLNKPTYTAATQKAILALLDELGLKKADASKWALLRQNHGKLLKRKKDGTIELVALGRDQWVGWVDLQVEMVDEIAIENTARVITDIAPDVIGVVEAESRPALLRFSDDVLPMVGGEPFEHVMLIDGNDDRGIDVGLMTKGKYPIVRMTSHVDDEDAQGEIFSRDCPEYTLRTEKGNTVTVLLNHFKSRIGNPAQSGGKRLRQATKVKEIYESLIARGEKYVAVMGDLNDDPAAPALDPLITQTTLKDIRRTRASWRTRRSGRGPTARRRTRSTTSCCRRRCTRW